MYYEEVDRQKALHASLLALARSMGYTPVKHGAHFKLKEMDSLVIYNDKTWNRFSGRGNITGGTQIDFVMEFAGCEDVAAAIEYILAFTGTGKTVIESRLCSQLGGETTSFRGPMQLPPRSKNYVRLYAYLTKKRKVDVKIVNYFVERHLAYEEANHHNIVFVGYDKDGEVKFATMRGTYDLNNSKWCGDVAGNDKNYGINLIHKSSCILKVFESTIDLMSYMDIYHDFNSNMLVLSMTHDSPLEMLLSEYDHIKEIHFCLDNDAAGIKASSLYMEKYKRLGYVVKTECPEVKDWNLWLQLKRGVKNE